MLKELKLKDYATLLGTLCGVFAIVLALPPIKAYRGAMFMIMVGIIADLLDGYVARKTGQFNDFGIEIDSLSDSLVFGVAPALIAFLTYTQVTTDMGLPGHHWAIMFIPSFILMAGGIVRLAWFNVSENLNEYRGMPIPVSAASLSVFMMADYFAYIMVGSHVTVFNKIMQWFIPVLMIFLAWCNTTSHLIYGKDFRKKSGKTKYIFLVMGILTIAEFVMMAFFREETAIIIFIILMGYLAVFVWFLYVGFSTAHSLHKSEHSSI
ncbi:MAG: CDP-alcohol phosphatidyltransferase family protein [Promethearchaeota archaeon]